MTGSMFWVRIVYARIPQAVAMLSMVAACGMLAACSDQGRSPEGDPPEVSDQAPGQDSGPANSAPVDSSDWAPSDFAVSLGMTMGAGQMRGHSIDPNGVVTRWNGRAIGQNSVDLGFISENQGDSLWAWVREADFFDTATQRTGNQEQFLSITAEGTTRRASWVVGPGVAVDDGPVQQLHDRIQAMIRQLEEQE